MTNACAASRLSPTFEPVVSTKSHCGAMIRLSSESRENVSTSRRRWLEMIDDPLWTPTDLATSNLWDLLKRGRITILDSFLCGARAVLVVKSSRVSNPRLPDGCFAFLEHALEVGALNAAAIDFGLSPSSASGRMSTALASMGLNTSGSKVPLAVALVAHSAHCTESHSGLYIVDPADPGVWIFYMQRPAPALCAPLTRGESRVAALLIEGLTYQQIAASSNTSQRTVANQISSVFRKARTSGRLGLLRRWIGCAPGAQLTALRVHERESLPEQRFVIPE